MKSGARVLQELSRLRRKTEAFVCLCLTTYVCIVLNISHIRCKGRVNLNVANPVYCNKTLIH